MQTKRIFGWTFLPFIGAPIDFQGKEHVAPRREASVHASLIERRASQDERPSPILANSNQMSS
jgi:hypothetical protein